MVPRLSPPPAGPSAATGATKSAASATTPPVDPKTATTAQLKYLHGLLGGKDGLKNALAAVFPGIIIQSSKELTKEQASKLIEWGKDRQAQAECGTTEDPFEPDGEYTGPDVDARNLDLE